ncbi:hypothetical protein PoB_005973600 [Plakobranchus ocellatus]|uniref:Uncharacterized protein n=1 Tax=Plakobranchus ocellatus TaxID=259542 RepID=A0AAV4CJY1_9GAST|nr:hypothetical protein PoB_005973600 [Plakobranchus ocellatus]
MGNGSSGGTIQKPMNRPGTLPECRKKALASHTGIPHKLIDKWSEDAYLVEEQPDFRIPIFVAQPGNKGTKRTQHRHLLLPVSRIREDSSEVFSEEQKTRETSFLISNTRRKFASQQRTRQLGTKRSSEKPAILCPGQGRPFTTEKSI